MTAELVRGQNHPLPQVRLEIRISAGVPVLAGATLGDEKGTVRGPQRVAAVSPSRSRPAARSIASSCASSPCGARRVSSSAAALT